MRMSYGLRPVVRGESEGVIRNTLRVFDYAFFYGHLAGNGRDSTRNDEADG